jgi:methylated-DNA-[protein]-cysteine S-methyltransferase
VSASGYALFDTSIGSCGIAWTERGIAAFQLPETGDGAIRVRMRRRFPEAVEQEPPASVRSVVDAVVSLLDGGEADLSRVVLDLDAVPEFHHRVYEEARTIAPGTTRSYGEIATALGDPGLARAVGRALAANPVAVIVPCHRVVAAGGSIGGFSAHGGTDTKRRLLAIEGLTEHAPQLALFD